MSNLGLIIEERSRDIGDFLVGRILPFRKKRMVGPFIFIDHMGPTKLSPGKYMEVDQHPHIGLSTLTYLIEGQIEHRDSLGTAQRIEPGSVNWMTAGSGITHTERTPEDLIGSSFNAHGYQIWVALPKEKEEIDPSFHHISKKDLPSWKETGSEFTLVAGKGFGRQSPVPVYSDLFMVEIKTDLDYLLEVQGELEGEIGIVIVNGRIKACGELVGRGNMLVSKTEDACQIHIAANSHIFLFGGKPLPEERFIYWNFVSSDKNRIEKAKEDWKNKAFPKVPGDDTYVPLPKY